MINTVGSIRGCRDDVCELHGLNNRLRHGDGSRGWRVCVSGSHACGRNQKSVFQGTLIGLNRHYFRFDILMSCNYRYRQLSF